MKVVHFCLSSFYIDDGLYQENELVREHVRAGHQVLVVASTEVFDVFGNLSYTHPQEYLGEEGAPVIRLPYRRWLPLGIGRKIRSYPRVRSILDDFAPDVIMFHGSSAWELRTVANYVRAHPDVIFHIDSHSDAINSGRRWISREILHKRIYAPVLHDAMDLSGPLLCVSKTVMDFAHRVYGIPRDRLEFYPLGGRLPKVETRAAYRRSVRAKLGISDEEVLIVQSGKQSRDKNLSMSLRVLAKDPNPNLRLVIAGVLQDDVREECEDLIAADSRVEFLGWQSSDELIRLLCAADVYLNPATQSATMQLSLCCGCAVILYASPAHEPYADGTGWLIKSEEDLLNAFSKLTRETVARCQRSALRFAAEKLDYQILARRLLK